jgi:hypothetical protein
MTAPPVWVAELAGRFWAAAGEPPPFPRDLERAIADAVPLSVLDRHPLTLHAVSAYLRGLGLPVAVAEPDRPLRAALYCWKGSGFLFLDAADPPDERRFSLAHELAHYLRDYDAFRRRVTRALGASGLAVLDGRRATTDERLHAALRGLTLAPHVHLMGRDPGGRPRGDAERDAEDRADRLAFELLAPAERFGTESDGPAVAERLIAAFGLPPLAARQYTSILSPPDDFPTTGVGRIINSVKMASNSPPED